MDPNCDDGISKLKIESLSRCTRDILNDTHAIEEAKNLVPIAQLVQDNIDILDGDYQDNLLPVLVSWFANDFFVWFKPPFCERCSEDSLHFDSTAINLEGKNLERYKCRNHSCSYSYDFIRHNDPTILLNTRRGRCGEWANCFLLFLRAMDYEARLIYDTTDHVWNEVWSAPKQRWVHIDPCEAVVDSPLLYEVGWSKQLKYCLAFGQYEVLDVTRRYSLNFNLTKQLRRHAQSSWLHSYLEDVTMRLIQLAPTEKQQVIVQRRNKDKEFLDAIPSGSRLEEARNGNFTARKTGGIEWRISRGEYSPVIDNKFIIKVNAVQDNCSSAQEGHVFELRYNCDRNAYDGSCEDHCRKGWSSLTYRAENLDYKYERDWRVSYIARYETCPSDRDGLIIWRFDVTGVIDIFKKIVVQIHGATYPNTNVEAILSTDDKSLPLSLNKPNIILPDHLAIRGDFIDLTVRLSGGDRDDPVAWQKPQLFRQERDTDANNWKLSLQIF